MRYSATLIGALAATIVSAHGDIDHEIAARKAMLQHTSRSVDHCAATLKARGLQDRAIDRRMKKRDELVKKRGIKARSLDTVLATNHNRTMEETIFSDWASCVLTAEGESGPFYVAGEYVREDLAEDQEGVPVHYDFQIIDVNTCEPIVGSYFEIFNANATGVYSGTTNTGNGNTDDVTVLDETFLRGLQPTDEEGVASFNTIFAGHYDGRATHIHTILHQNATVRDNGTVYDLTAQHIGQVFWDQSTRDLVETVYPYNTNTKALTANDEDRIIQAETETEGTSDPMVNFVQLGDKLEDGLLAWIILGVNTTLSTSTLSPAAIYYGSGGVEEQ